MVFVLLLITPLEINFIFNFKTIAVFHNQILLENNVFSKPVYFYHS